MGQDGDALQDTRSAAASCSGEPGTYRQDKDAKGIFYDPPGSGKPVVQDALWSRIPRRLHGFIMSVRRAKASSTTKK